MARVLLLTTKLTNQQEGSDMKPERVEQVMSRNVATCRADDRLNAAAQIMWDRDCGVVPVTEPGDDGERIVGILTDRDVCMAAYTQGLPLIAIPVASAMSRGIETCAPTDTLSVALRRMATARVHRLPVVDAFGHLVGLLSLADVAHEDAIRQRAVAAGEIVRTVEAITTPRPHELTVAA
jgi:CBS domain-containing protein